jgi:uncharacterized HAD superfamily protein
MRNLKIAIDIDGVIVDLVTAMLPLLSKACGRPVHHEDIYCFDIGKALNIESKMQYIWDQVYHSDILQTAPPIKGAIMGLDKLSNHEIWLVTHRPKWTQQDTELWLKEKKIKYHRLEFVRSTKKLSVGPDFDVFLEDNLEQACAIAEAGIQAILLSHPWNTCTTLPEKCIRVSDWDAITRQMYIFASRS